MFYGGKFHHNTLYFVIRRLIWPPSIRAGKRFTTEQFFSDKNDFYNPVSWLRLIYAETRCDFDRACVQLLKFITYATKFFLIFIFVRLLNKFSNLLETAVQLPQHKNISSHLKMQGYIVFHYNCVKIIINNKILVTVSATTCACTFSPMSSVLLRRKTLNISDYPLLIINRRIFKYCFRSVKVN